MSEPLVPEVFKHPFDEQFYVARINPDHGNDSPLCDDGFEDDWEYLRKSDLTWHRTMATERYPSGGTYFDNQVDADVLLDVFKMKNGNLSDAAPDLLKCCQGFVSAYDGNRSLDGLYEQMKAAIAKALGETQ